MNKDRVVIGSAVICVGLLFYFVLDIISILIVLSGVIIQTTGLVAVHDNETYTCPGCAKKIDRYSQKCKYCGFAD